MKYLYETEHGYYGVGVLIIIVPFLRLLLESLHVVSIFTLQAVDLCVHVAICVRGSKTTYIATSLPKAIINSMHKDYISETELLCLVMSRIIVIFNVISLNHRIQSKS